MTLIIHSTPDPGREIRVGYGRVVSNVIESPVSTPITEPKKRGRAKMADKKLKDETGTETIRKDKVEKGAIGSHGENAPAQEKVPEKPEGDKDNG